MTDTFAALSDPTRRQILDRLKDGGGLTVSEIGRELPITRQAVSKHLAVLESAELVASMRDGRCKRHYLNPMPLAKLAKRWLSSFDEVPLGALEGFRAGRG
ncbi:ArsR/SmtB family transcription factor [Altererythrobacter sp. MF3-039]|uniref:ArsR/SmtB family transcription factor n=1 Tax=Altererythrobacter sp. MF3-039 TaxID=3252901 RepID=UPI00390CB5A1